MNEDAEERLGRIRSWLSALEPGLALSLRAEQNFGGVGYGVRLALDDKRSLVLVPSVVPALALLWAHAPADLAWLLSEVERLTAERDEQAQYHDLAVEELERARGEHRHCQDLLARCIVHVSTAYPAWRELRREVAKAAHLEPDIAPEGDVQWRT